MIIYPIYINNMFDNYKRIGVSLPQVYSYITTVLEMVEKFKILNSFKVLNVPYCLVGKYAKRSSDFYSFGTVVSKPGGMKWNIDENVKKIKQKGMCVLIVGGKINVMVWIKTISIFMVGLVLKNQ